MSSKTKRLEDDVIRALLTCQTLTEAAKTAHVSRQTVYDKLKNPEFVERYEAERERVNRIVSDSIAESIADAATSAIATLKAYAEGTGGLLMVSDGDRIRAAETILDIYARTAGKRYPQTERTAHEFL
ncbi:hypothetical protein I7648_05530 [Collinsella tanakaei]|nr:hypothetical protein [Collinsella tanakaei]